jgi:hypothetical protein
LEMHAIERMKLVAGQKVSGLFNGKIVLPPFTRSLLQFRVNAVTHTNHAGVLESWRAFGIATATPR